VDFDEYAKEIRRLYETRCRWSQIDEARRGTIEGKMLEQMGRDTYMVAVYLPCHLHASKDGSAPQHKTVSGSQLEVVVKYPGLAGIDVVCVRDIPRTPLNKHLNASKMKVYYK